MTPLQVALVQRACQQDAAPPQAAAPAATPAPLPALSTKEVLSGEWMDQFDRHLKEITAGIPGAKASRHGWIRDLVYRELASATPEGAALAVFRAKAAEAAALDAAQTPGQP